MTCAMTVSDHARLYDRAVRWQDDSPALYLSQMPYIEVRRVPTKGQFRTAAAQRRVLGFAT